MSRVLTTGLLNQEYIENFPVIATGGDEWDIVQGGDIYRIHAFYSNGSFVVKRKGFTMDVLLIAGGGGGGGRHGGGGGGGGFLFASATLPLAITYSVTVGQGGAGGVNGSIDQGANGGDSLVFGLRAYGGGGGAGGFDGQAGDGGSGGGGTSVRLPGDALASQGHDGGLGVRVLTSPRYWMGGGGGGGGTVGGDWSISGGIVYSGDGGTGLYTNFWGTYSYFCGGGAGGGYEEGITFIPGTGGLGGGGDVNTNGTDGLGGGGGGGNYLTAGADGGDGIVLIKYKKY